MAILLVVDLQREFVKDEVGLNCYKRCINYIKNCRHFYSSIYASVYKNQDLRNMLMLTRWEDMKKIQPLDFVPDRMFVHSGYSAVNKMALPSDVHIDVIGLDTDACVLSHCFDLFDKDIPFHVLVDGCYSSGGAEMHEIGVKILQRQFNNAVDTVTKLDNVVKAQKVVSRDYLNNK